MYVCTYALSLSLQKRFDETTLKVHGGRVWRSSRREHKASSGAAVLSQSALIHAHRGLGMPILILDHGRHATFESSRVHREQDRKKKNSASADH